jgi:hypothetical protein
VSSEVKGYRYYGRRRRQYYAFLYRTDVVTDFRSFDGVYVLSGLNNELTNSVSNALMETSEVLKVSGRELCI